MKIKIIVLMLYFYLNHYNESFSQVILDANLDYQTRAKVNQVEFQDSLENLHYFNTKIFMENEFSDTTKGIFSFSAEKPASKGFLMYEIPEAYLDSEFSRSNLKVGRTILKWSELDAQWKLGILNSRKHFSIIDPSQVGLNVISYSYDFNPLKISFVGSYLYVPERYPSQDFKDGKIICTSNYCKEYWDHVLFSNSGIKSPLYYEKEQQSLSEIVFRKTYGMNFELTGDNQTFNMFYMYKPENRYRIYGVSKVYTEQNYTHAKIRGEFFDHHLIGGDFRLNLGFLDFVTSTLTVIPENDKEINIDQDTNNIMSQNKKRNSFINIGFDKDFRRGNVKLHYLKELSNSSVDDKESSMPSKIAWSDALNFVFEGNLGKKWRSLFDIKVDTNFSDAVLAWEAKYFMAKNFVMGFGMEVIHSSKDDSYWAPFRDQDVAFSSLTYFF